MPVNAHPEYIQAEKEYFAAEGIENKIRALEKMISLAPKHKGGENLRAQLKTRLKKLREQVEKSKKTGRSTKLGIKKEDMQAVIVGLTKTGKSSLLRLLTKASPEINYSEEARFITKFPVVGIMYFEGANIQLIEIPAIESEYYDKGLVNSADVILILIKDLKQIPEIEEHLGLGKTIGKRIIIFNSVNKTPNELRKIDATLKSKRYDYTIINLNSVGAGGWGLDGGANAEIENLKEKIFKNFGKIRIYTKEPGKQKSEKPIILPPNSIVKDVAEKILKGFSNKVKETKIWGPSSKFPGQKVGLQHELKDLDVVEFKTR